MLAEGQQDPSSFRPGAARTGNQAGFLLRETRGAWVFGGSDVLLAEQEKREVVDLPELQAENGYTSSGRSCGGGALLNRCTNQVAPLSPRAVVVLHIFVAEQIFQNKPGMTGSFSNAAISNDGLGARDAFVLIQRLEFIERLEGPVIVAGFRPGDATSAGNVPAALTRLWQAGRRKNLTSEFRTTANVYEFHSTLTHRCLDLR